MGFEDTFREARKSIGDIAEGRVEYSKSRVINVGEIRDFPEHSKVSQSNQRLLNISNKLALGVGIPLIALLSFFIGYEFGKTNEIQVQQQIPSINSTENVEIPLDPMYVQPKSSNIYCI